MSLDVDPLSVVKISCKDDSPWSVTSIHEFQFYCCPGCESYKSYKKQDFVNHAFQSHPEALDHLSVIRDGSLADLNLPWSVDVIDDIKEEEGDEIEETGIEP
jgi:hypothetical protein